MISHMLQSEASAQVRTCCQDLGVPGAGLGPDGWGGVELPEGTLLFEFDAARACLTVSAFVERFAVPPDTRLLARLQEAAPGAGTAGGQLVYRAEQQCLWLSREYAQAVDADLFLSQVQALFAASRRWEMEVVPAVTAQGTGSRA
jgi:hypothetical protein